MLPGQHEGHTQSLLSWTVLWPREPMAQVHRAGTLPSRSEDVGWMSRLEQGQVNMVSCRRKCGVCPRTAGWVALAVWPFSSLIPFL